MKFSAGQIAELLGGTVDGDAGVEVEKLSKIEEGEPGSLSFLANPLYTPHIYSTSASIVIVQQDFEPEKPLSNGTTLIRVSDAYSSFGKLLELYDKVRHDKKGIDSGACIADSATVGEDVYVGAGTFVGEKTQVGDETKIYPNVFIGDNVKIGKRCVIYPGVKIYLDCKIGDDCIVHAGVVVGSDGFGFSPNSENNYKKVPQIGNVILEDHVEIGSNTTIDRATMGSTIIRKGVKIDNLVQIAHNVEVGENTVIAAQTGIAGSTKIGKNCMIGGQVGIVGHLTIGDNVKIAAQSGIGSNVKDNEILQGSPAFSVSEYQRAYVNFRNLSKLNKRLDELERSSEQKKSEK